MKQKLMLISLVPLLIASGIIASIIFQMNAIRANSSADVKNLVYVEQLDGALLSIQTSLNNYYFSATDANANDVREKLKKAQDIIKTLNQMVLAKEQSAQLDKIERKLKTLQADTEVLIKKKENAQAKKQSIRIKGIANDLYLLKMQATGKYEEGQKQLNEKIDFIRIFSTVVAIVLLVGAGIVVYWQASRIAKSIEELSQHAQAVANGDLTVRTAEMTTNDELGVLNRSFHKMIEALKEILGAVHTTAHNLAAAAEELSAGADETSNGAEQIAAAIGEIATGAENQTVMAQESAREAEEAVAGVARIAQSAATVTDLTEATKQQALDGQQAVTQTVQQMNFIHASVDRTDESIKALSNKSKEIGEIMNMITHIAKQTNLLALNAAIEAARAGESGRGFAIVAEEVRKLAEQTASSAEQIHEIIREVQDETTTSVQSINDVKEKVKEGMRVTNEAARKFEEIVGGMVDVVARIYDISTTSERISKGSKEVAASVKEMANVAKQTSENTSHVAAASEEQLASMEEIRASADSLTIMAEELQRIVQRFKI
ncbi:MAG: methyl-accepting chemotaxis protein [Ectobacillus sp.]